MADSKVKHNSPDPTKYHSDSPDDKAIGPCVVEDTFKQWVPIITTVADVDLRVRKQPA